MEEDAALAIYHEMYKDENFEDTAEKLFEFVRQAEASHPGQERILYLDVEGPRNKNGGFDSDAFEILQDFLLGTLMPFVAEIYTPLYEAKNPKPQNNAIPAKLQFTYPPEP